MKKLKENYTSNILKFRSKIKQRKQEIAKMEEEIVKRDELRKNIQSKFKFEIPLYILDEIIKNSDKNIINLYINMAVKGGSITKEQAEEIREKIPLIS